MSIFSRFCGSVPGNLARHDWPVLYHEAGLLHDALLSSIGWVSGLAARQ